MTHIPNRLIDTESSFLKEIKKARLEDNEEFVRSPASILIEAGVFVIALFLFLALLSLI